MRTAALAALTMLAFGCQPINEEPDAGPPVNHPPRIVEGFGTPQSTVIEVLQATDNCTNELDFSVGKVEDDDIDQTVQERWVVDYDPNSATPAAVVTVTLQAVDNAPSFRTDPPKAFVLLSNSLKQLQPTSQPHTIDVFISDGFDDVGQPGKSLKPTDVLPGYFLVRKSWVVYFAGGTGCPLQ